MDGELLLEYILWWVFFGSVHTLFTLQWVKAKIPLNGLKYRIFYNVIATVSLLMVLINTPSIVDIILSGFALSGMRLILFLVFLGTGAGIGILGLLAWNIPGFLGLVHEKGELNTKGIYAFSRHPVYTAALLIFLAGVVATVSEGSLAWLLGAGGYFVVGTIPEEMKLSNHFDKYIDYRRVVGRFFPWKPSHLQYLTNQSKSS